MDVLTAEDIYRKYVESSIKIIKEKFLSSDTDMIHISPLSYAYGIGCVESAPLEENILYTLLLLRTKTHEALLSAQTRLCHILQYQNRDGSFPSRISELGSASDWYTSFRILFILSQIREGFQTIWNHVEQFEKSFQSLFVWCKELIEAEKIPASRYAFLLLFSSTALIPEPDSSLYQQYFIEACSAFSLSDDFLDMSISGELLIAIFRHSLLLQQISESTYSVFIDRLHHLLQMWHTISGYVGPSFSLPQYRSEVACFSGHIVLSLLTQTPIKQKLDTILPTTLFSLALLHPLYMSAIPISMKSKFHPIRYGFFSKEATDIAPPFWASWIFGSSNPRQKSFSPLRINSLEWNCVMVALGYELVAYEEKEQNVRNFYFKIEREEEAHILDVAASPIASFYIERKPSIGFMHEDGSKSSYFHHEEQIRFGDMTYSSSYPKLSIASEDAREPEKHSFRVRAGDRPGQLSLFSQNIMKERKIPFHEGHDWVLDYRHVEGCKPKSFMLSLYFV